MLVNNIIYLLHNDYFYIKNVIIKNDLPHCSSDTVINELLFVYCRYSTSIERTITMSRRTYGVSSIVNSRTARLLSQTWRSRTGLQQKSGQISEEFTIKAQGTETEVSYFWTKFQCSYINRQADFSSLCQWVSKI